MPVTITGTAQPSRVINMALQNVDELDLEHYLEIIILGGSDGLTNIAIRNALVLLRDSTITVKTIRRAGRDVEADYVHTEPVIKRISDRSEWVTPRGRIIFEPGLEGVRHSYHARQYKPIEVTIMVGGKQFKWTLVPETNPRPYDVMGNDTSGFIPATNTTTFGAGNRFTIFHYIHDEDTKREYPARIFYKIDDDWMRLHCVSIPLKLLALLINDYGDDRRPPH